MGFSVSVRRELQESDRADLYPEALGTSPCQSSWIFNGHGNRHGFISDGE